MFHQVNILSIYSNHLWSKNITISTACVSTHWTAHIKCITSNKLLSCSILLKTRPFSHLAHVVWFACLKWFKIRWVQRSINMELLHAFYTIMTYMAVPQVSGTIITILYLLAWTCVSLRSRFQWTIHFRCKTIEGIIQINRVTIILLKWITVLR